MSKIILTGNYENCKIGNTFSISNDKGKSVDYNGKNLNSIASKLSSINVNYEENNMLYIKEFYNKILKQLDPEEVLLEIPNKSILLDYKNSKNRHLIAFWLELFMEIKTYEVRVDVENKKLIILNRPEHLKDKLEKVIKENYNMSCFNSIRAAYLFQQASELERVYEEQADEWVRLCGSVPSGDYPGTIMTEAAGLRVEADEIEARYIKQKRKII